MILFIDISFLGRSFNVICIEQIVSIEQTIRNKPIPKNITPALQKPPIFTANDDNVRDEYVIENIANKFKSILIN